MLGDEAIASQHRLRQNTPPEPPQAGQAGHDTNDARSDITSTTAEEPGLSARDVVIAGSGRKKRFPLLRKAFGLRK